MIDPKKAGAWHAAPDAGFLNVDRRDVLRAALAAGVVAGSAKGMSTAAEAFAYEPYPTNDELTTVVTSCAHNCGSRHMLVAHKKGDVIVRLSTDDGRYQAGGAFGAEAITPFANGPAVHTLGRGHGRNGPTRFETFDHQHSTARRGSGILMNVHPGLLEGGSSCGNNNLPSKPRTDNLHSNDT
mgnify:CR=1 FL=1